jgi:hypothetical protein
LIQLRIDLFSLSSNLFEFALEAAKLTFISTRYSLFDPPPDVFRLAVDGIEFLKK